MATPNEVETLPITKTVFDLDSKADVTVVKRVPFTAVQNTKDALERVGNDAKQFLEIVNNGLREYAKEQARNDGTPWHIEDEEGNLQPFSGSLLTEERSKQLGVNALYMAKMLFGYAKDMPGGREAKRAAKEKAFDMLLSNPQVVEALKS